MAEAAPRPSRTDIPHLSGGPAISTKTAHRVEVLRWAAVASRAEIFPLGAESESMEDIALRIQWGIREEYMISWAPDMTGARTFPRDLLGREGRW